jgi:hypothetical protein
MFDWAEDSPAYTKTQEDVVAILKTAGHPLTMGELKRRLGSDRFLADAIEILEFMGMIGREGSVMLPTYSYIGLKKVANDKKICGNCQAEKPLIEFYQEWAGSPSRLCKTCKIASQKKRGRQKKK